MNRNITKRYESWLLPVLTEILYVAFDNDINFQTAIIKNNPKKAVRSVGDGEVFKMLWRSTLIHVQKLFSQSSMCKERMT